MADHAEANPSKGAGKTPRVSRARRTSSGIPKPSASSTIPQVPNKRKSLSRETAELRSPKVRRVENRSNTSDSSKTGPRTTTEKRYKKKASTRTDSSSATRSSTRELRKRKSESEVEFSVGTRKEAQGLTCSSESEEEVVTTDRSKKVPVSTVPPKEETLTLAPGTGTKTSSKANKSAGQPASSSAGASATGGTSGRHSARNFSTHSTTNLTNSRPQKANKNKPKATSGATAAAPSTSEEETRAESLPGQNIASRLRLTPSRAAAAASLQKSLTSSSASGTSIDTSTNPSSPTFNTTKSKSTRPSKHLKFSKKKPASATTRDSSSSVPVTTTATSATTDTDDQEESSSAAGSSSNLRAPYQLRSRYSVDSTNSNCSASSKGNSSKDKSSKSSSQTSLASTLRSAHILSEKEKNLQKKAVPPASAAPSTSATANRASSSTALRAAHTRSGRVTSTTAKSSSGTTGTCTSSRCGRGGGPSSSGTSGVPLTGSGKPGEPGMNNQPPTTSGQSSSGAQAGSASSAVPASGSTGAEGPTSTTSLSAAAAASAFSRGLAMLTGDSDGDEGEMGRLQALLEARGLPPHLFGSLAPRMQQLLNRGMSSSTVSKAQQLLQGLQATGDEGQQLQAAIEMCQLLVMGNEDTLAGFPVKQTVPALISLLAMEHNFDMMNHACRALTYMMEALPRSTPVVAEAVPLFLEKLQVIQCMDVAEQSLTALEMLSRRHAKTILTANGVSACLTFLDFFSITAQRAALAVTANCCQGVHLDEFHLVGNSLDFLASRLTQQDKKSVESVCLIFSRLVDSFLSDAKRIEEISSGELLSNVQQLLVVTPPVVSTVTFILVLRMLAQICSRCPNIALKLLEQNIVSTLSSLLLGSANVNTDIILDEVELVPRNPQELLEIVTVIGELLPKLPKDGIFMVNTMMTHPHLTCQDAIQWQWRDDRGTWTSYSSFDSRIIEAAHQSGEDEISLTLQARTYTIDFLGMQQINEDSGTARPVQRKLNPFFNPRAPTEPTEKETSDVRSSFLATHPDFALPFLRPLFALLSEANSSSAGPAVRQSCVKTLLRIVHFLEPESLQKTLKPQQVSNNLASMLGSSDLKIVVGAFQLSHLFMEKLHPIYVIHFRREGVFHQISRISSSEVVGPSPIKSEIAALLGISGLSSSGGITSVPTVSTVNSNPSTSYPHVPLPFVQMPSLFARPNNQAPLPVPLPVGIPTGRKPLALPSDPVVPNPPPSFSTPIQATSPFSLCVGGFFVQPGAALAAAGGSGALPQPIPSLLDNQNANQAGNSIVPPYSAPVDLAQLPNPSGANLAESAEVGTPTGSGKESGSTSSSDGGGKKLSTPLTGSDTPSGSSSGSSEKKPDMEPTVVLMDPFKRKRTSKRPIPTSTSRRLRQDDTTLISSAGAATASSVVQGRAISKGEKEGTSGAAGSSSSQSSSATASGRRSGGGKSTGFFASLHPSRWTRGGGSNSSAAANNNAPSSSGSTVGPNAPDRPHGVNNNNLNAVGPHGTNPCPGALRGHNSSAYLAISYKEQVKTWLKEQSLIFSQKHCRVPVDASETTSKNTEFDSVGILPKLGEIIGDFRKVDKMLNALRELRTVVLESDISPFEVNHSGLIGALLGFLVEEEGYKASREQRLRSFIHIFADCPLEELSGEELDACLTSGSKASGLSSLVTKLNSCFSQLEQFQVKVHEVPTSSGSSRVAPSSALRFFNTHQLKCVLQRHPSCTSLRQWKGGPVKIDPLALVQAIERYLIVRGFGRVRESRDSGDSDDDNSDDDIDDSLAAVVISQGATRHKLQFIMNDQVLPYNMTVYQAIRQYGGSGIDPGGDLDSDFIDPATSVLGSSGIWSQTHTIYYRPVSEDGVPAAIPQPAPTKTSSKKNKSPSSKSSKSKKDPLWHAVASGHGVRPRLNTRSVNTQSSSLLPTFLPDPETDEFDTQMLRAVYPSGIEFPRPQKHKPASDEEQWEGIVPVPAAPYVPYLTSRLPETVTVSDPGIPVLTLLRVIHAICRYWRSLYWPVLPGPTLLPAGEFINTKLAAKAQRQLQDPVVIMTGNLPQWLQQVGVACPFLFPFETRQMLFYSISFDRDRALQRLLDNVPELNSTEREDRVTPRLDRRKRTISRDQILAQAEQLMQDFSSSRPLLEVQYENEVGTGLGPTLEFYALVSQELQKKELDLWHCESSHSIGDEIVDIKSKSYVQSSVGLFPKPLSKSVKAATLSKVKSKFKFIGRFMAKAVMDSRMIDLPLSKTQYKWILGYESTLNLADIADVDPTVAQSIRKLVSVVSAKKKLEQKSGLSGAELNQALEALTLDGCRIDNLGLDFTLPGHSGIELRKGGRDTTVTIYNLEEYIKLVCHWMLVGGVYRQMESWREGFDLVFPSSSLRMFYPEELEMVFCGANQSLDEPWDLKALAECCRPDHGFTTESRAMQFLFEILSSYDAQERRQFVQFVTGSPRLPVGGFKALQPPLTIVRKTIDSGDEDSFLPSVMTCVNYLKLPDYSTKEIMIERLRVAADEGQMSFHLS